MKEKIFSKQEVIEIIKNTFNEGYQYAFYEQVLGNMATPKDITINDIINKLTK